MRFVEGNGKNMSGVRANFVPFGVTGEERGDAAYLRVSGEIDMATAPVLDERLRAAQSNGYTGIVVDLEHVTFMDTSGLHSLLRAAEEARRNDKTFAVVKTPAIVNKVLQITGNAHLLAKSDAAFEINTSREVGKVWIDRSLADRALAE